MNLNQKKEIAVEPTPDVYFQLGLLSPLFVLSRTHAGTLVFGKLFILVYRK